jgi:hypothetical protein
MIRLVDFVARGLGRGVIAGAHSWVLFGCGAILGPLIAGRLGNGIGFAAASRLALAVQAVAVCTPTIGSGTAELSLSSIVVGAFVPGVVPLALGRVHELVPHEKSRRRPPDRGRRQSCTRPRRGAGRRHPSRPCITEGTANQPASAKSRVSSGPAA